MTKTTMVNEKSTKGAIVEFLKAAKTKNVDLRTKIRDTLKQYAKDMTTVTKKDLLSLIYDLEANNGLKPVETALKPKNKLKPKEVKTEPKVEEVEEPEEQEPKSKKNKKAKQEEKPLVKSSKSISSKSADTVVATLFPERINHKELGELAKVDLFTSYEELKEELTKEDGATIYFACYWNKSQIKKFDYAGTYKVKSPKSFEFDLDFAMAVLPCETIERVFCQSMITEAMYYFDGDSLEYVTDKDPVTGEAVKIRVTAGMEYELYVPLDWYVENGVPSETEND